MKRFSLLFLISTLSTIAFAGGFQINAQGPKQSGMGHTGTGLLLDNSSIFFNPGAVSFLDSLRGFSIGGSFIFARTAYLEPFPGNYIANTNRVTAAPFTLYAVYKFHKKDKWNVGLGIYNPFGNKVQWEDNWKGQFIIQEINFKILFIQPTFSYKLNKKLGIGLGLIYATGNYRQRRAIAIQDTTGSYGGTNLKGKASGAGFNVGIYIKANEKFSIGIDYRSAVNAAIKGGTADFTVASSAANDYQNTKFSTNLNLPQVFSLGFGYVVNSKLKLALDANYTGWEIHDSMIIDFAENSEKLKDVHEATMYENSFTFRIGGQYQLTKKWTTRLGAYYDLSPVKDGYFTPETSDADKLGITLGATYRVNKRVNIDLSMIYIEGMKRTDTNINTQFSGTYKTKTIWPGVSLEFVF